MPDEKLTAIEATNSPSMVDLLYTVKDPSGSPLSRKTTFGDVASKLFSSLEDHFSLTIGASNTWNNELVPVWQAPRNASATIIEILGSTSGGVGATLSFNFQKRDWGQLTSAGIDLFSASQVATSAGEQFATFAEDTIDPRGYLMFTTGSGAESGSINYLLLSVYYKKTY